MMCRALIEFFERINDEENGEELYEHKRLPMCPPDCKWGPQINKIIPTMSKLLTAYTVIGLYAFFFVALCLSINMVIELSFEVLSPYEDRDEKLAWLLIMKREFLRETTIVVLLSLVLNCTFVLSLIWEVTQPFHKETRVCYFWVKILLVGIDLIAGIIWSSVTSANFLECLSLFSFIKAGFFSLFGCMFLLKYVYTKRNKNLFPRNRCSLTKFLIYCGALFALPLMYVCPILYIVGGASGFACALAFLMPYISYIIIFFLFSRGSRKEESGFLLRRIVVVLMGVAFVIVVSVFCFADYHCAKEGCQLGLPRHKWTRPLALAAENRREDVLGYQMCQKKWGPLTLTDMVFFADLAYKTHADKKDNATAIINDYFIHRGLKWTIVTIKKRPSFYHIYNLANRVNIIGIRGSTDARDWIENGKIWNEVLIFQVLFSLVPLSSVIPTNTIANYISFAAVMDYAYAGKKKTYINVIENYLQKEVNFEYKIRNKKEVFYLAGHSLGGGLAKIIGSRLKLQAISISSPGEIYNHKKYSYSLDDLQKYTTSFGSRDDLISWIDKPGGLVQNVRKESWWWGLMEGT